MNPNAVMGLGSKLNTSEIIDRFIKIEKRRLQPVEQRKEEKLQQEKKFIQNLEKFEKEKLIFFFPHLFIPQLLFLQVL